MALSPLKRVHANALAARRLFGPSGRKRAGGDGLSEDARRVLGELAKFCRLDQEAAGMDRQGRVDPYALAIHEGRRQAFLKLVAPLKLSDLALQRLAQMAREDF